MQWYNEPPHWEQLPAAINDKEKECAGLRLRLTTGAETDFWRKTHYGFIRDNGHFYYQTTEGNFSAQVKVTGNYRVLYDQAGLMVRENENTWLKCGIEYVNGVQNVSAVVTRDFSDWSVVPLAKEEKDATEMSPLWLRLNRRNEAIEIEYSLDNGETYQMLRLVYLTLAKKLQVGLMAASPKGEGCEILFENFKVTTSV